MLSNHRLCKKLDNIQGWRLLTFYLKGPRHGAVDFLSLAFNQTGCKVVVWQWVTRGANPVDLLMSDHLEI